MVKISKEIDAVQLGILVVAGISMLCGFWAYCETHFASRESVENLTQEVHAIYEKMIPEAERHQ